MIDSVHLLLLTVVTILTALLVVVGVQVFYILGEVRRSIEKLNKILSDAGVISESLAKPFSSFSNSFEEISKIAGFLGWLRGKKRGKKEENEGKK